MSRYPLLLRSPGILAFLALACSPAGPAAPASDDAQASAHTDELRRIGEELYAGDCPQYGRAPREKLAAELRSSELKPVGRI